MRIFTLLLCMLYLCSKQPLIAQSQQDWTKDEKKYYKTLYEFTHYLHDVPWADWSMKKVFKKYIEFDYVLQDSNEYAVDRHKGLFFFKAIDYVEFINNVGIEYLDAMPARFFIQRDSVAQELYRYLEENIPESPPRLFFCYDRRQPDKMLAPVLFSDPRTSHKIITWMISDLDGHKEFILFNAFE